MTFAAGEHLFERGGAKGRVFVLVEGLVEATRDDPHVVWQGGGAGQVVAGTVSFSDEGLEWQATARSSARALAFTVDDWLDVMEENFEMVRATLSSLAMEHERLGGEL